jgi:hypothetical protein
MDRSSVIRSLAIGSAAIGLTCVIGIELVVVGPLVPRLGAYLLLVAIAAVVVAVLLQRPALVTLGTSLLLLTYATALVGRSSPGVAMRTVGVVAGGIFLVAELGWWLVDLRTPAHEDMAAIGRQASRYGVAAVGVGVLAEVALQMSRIPLGRGVEFSIIGVLSLAGIVGLAAWLAAGGTLLSTGNVMVPNPARGGPQSPARSGLHPRSRQLGPLWNWLVGSPLAPQRHRSPQALIAQTALAIVLLLLDAATVLVVAAGSMSSAPPLTSRTVVHVNLGPAVEVGIVLGGAIIVTWMVRVLAYIASPTVSVNSGPRPSVGLGTQISELEAIRDACKNASETDPLTGELRHLLASISDLLARDPRPSPADNSSWHARGDFSLTEAEIRSLHQSTGSDGDVHPTSLRRPELDRTPSPACQVGAVIRELEAMADD